MTKNLGTDYDQREKKAKPGVVSWLFDLLFPLVLVTVALAIGRYSGSFW